MKAFLKTMVAGTAPAIAIAVSLRADVSPGDRRSLDVPTSQPSTQPAPQPGPVSPAQPPQAIRGMRG